MAKKKYETDRHGNVLLKAKGSNEIFKVRPESVEVWLEDGHTVVDPEKKTANAQPDDVKK